MTSEVDALQDHVSGLSQRLAFGEVAGSFVVFGIPPQEVLAGLAAAASGVTLVAKGRRAKEALRWLESVSPAWVQIAPLGGDGLPELEETHHHALIWELSRSDPVGALERALFSVADEGRVFLSVERHRGTDGKLERLFRSSCDEGVGPAEDGPASRLTLEGVRRAPYPADLEDEAPGTLPLDVILVSRGAEPGLEESLIDLFLRQGYPPNSVFVMDTGVGTAPVPTDLFSLPERSPVKAVLVPASGAGFADAVNDALGGVEAPFVSLMRAGSRLAPNHLAALGMALEADEDLAAVVAHWAAPNVAGSVRRLKAPPTARPKEWLRSLLNDGLPPVEAALFRTEVLRALKGLDPTRGEGALGDLWFRLAADLGLGRLALPLVSRERPEAWPSGQALRWLQEEFSLARLGAQWPELPAGDREGAALRARGAALRRAGDPTAALIDFTEALGRDAGDRAAGDGWLAAMLESGGEPAILSRADEILADDPEGVAPRLAVARAQARRGLFEEASETLDALLAGHPASPAARLGRLLLHLRDDPAGRELLAPMLEAERATPGSPDPAFWLRDDDLTR